MMIIKNLGADLFTPIIFGLYEVDFEKQDRTVFRIERYICKTLEFFTDFLWKTWKTWNLTSKKFATEQKSTGKRQKVAWKTWKTWNFIEK